MSDPFRSGPSSPRRPHGSDEQPFAEARAEALEEAADRARLAPSVHNTQPWTLVVGGDRLTLRADRSRHLAVLDPAGRALVLSVGAALFNARAALAAHGWAVEVTRLPRADDPDLLAEIRPVPGQPDSELALLDLVTTRRHTNRRRFGPDPVPEDVLRRLGEIAQQEDAELVDVRDETLRRLVARLTQQADQLQNSDPAYRAELRRWTTRPHSAGDGVPPAVVPHVDGLQHDELPIRDFDTVGTGALPAETGSDADQTLVLIVTRDDDRLAWLRAGEAFEHLLLELTRRGWATSPVTQALEVPATRSRLRSALPWGAHPQMLLRIGHAQQTVGTPRRRRDDAVRNSDRPEDPLYVRQRPRPPRVPSPESAPVHHRPVPDGRGGTTDIDVP